MAAAVGRAEREAYGVTHLDARANVALAGAFAGSSAAHRAERAAHLLDLVGLADRIGARPSELSGGQQQRVAVARAIAGRPALVLADEPTANLDSKTSESLIELMKQLNAEHGITFLFSTHDPMVMEAARRVVRLDSGEIVADERVSAP